MDKKRILFHHIILLFLSGGIIFLFNNYLQNFSVKQPNQSRRYIVVQAFGAINYHEPLTFKLGCQVNEIIGAFDLQRGANLTTIFYKKTSLIARQKVKQWQKIASYQKIYEDSHLKIGF